MVHEDDRSVEVRLVRLEGLVEELLRRLPDPAAAAPAPLDAAAAVIAAAPLAAAESVAPEATVTATSGLGSGDAEPSTAADAEPEPRPRAPDGPRVGGERSRARGAYDPLFDRASAGDEPRPAPRVRPDLRLDSAFWLNKLGIMLVLVGIAVLFRYSILRGWLTPLVRVLFGMATGFALLGAGLWMDGKKQRFVSVLYGGGMAVFYIVGFAAYQVYELVGYVPAFVAMAGVSVVTFGLAMWKNEQALAVLAALGGLGVPLVLGIDHGQPAGFAAYTCFILAWTAGLHLGRGWRGLHWLSMVGAWLLLVLFAVNLHDGPGGFTARWMVQGAALFAWLATSFAPLAQEIVRGPSAAPARSLSTDGAADDGEEEDGATWKGGWSDADALHWHGVALLPALLGLLIASLVWSPTVHQWGAMALAAAAVYGLAALAVHDRHEPASTVLMLAASLLLSVGTVAAFDGDALLLILAGEGVALQVLASRANSTALSGFGHGLYAAAAWWLLLRLANPASHETGPAAANLAVIATGAAISMLLPVRAQATAYRLFVHVALLGWIWTILSPFSEGWVTVAWGAYGLGLLLYAMGGSNGGMERVAIGTLLLVVAKLFLVDLARLDPLWRVLLFLGMGVVFLALSYFIQSRFKAAAADPAPAPKP
jgi:uncharacterized membrane protein